MGLAQRLAKMAAVTAVTAAVVLTTVSPAGAVAATPTAAPTLAYPAMAATVSGNPILRWLAVPGAVKYRVQVSRTSSFATLLLNVDTYGLRATPTTDLPIGVLYWRVAATNGGTGVGPYSLGQFTKTAAKGPALVAPADGAVLAYPSQPPVLRWSALTSVKSYRVEVDDADDFVGAQVYSTANTAYALAEPLILSKVYYWRVQGVSVDGVTGAFSEVRRFQTDWPASTGKPTLIAPASSTTTEITDVVFQWQPVAGAKSYQIQVSPNPLFDNNITDDKVVKGTQYSPATTYNNANYYWRVRALDTGTTQHQGPWSDAWQFRRALTDKPVAISPIGGVGSPARFMWDGVAHAGYYELQVATDVNFSAYHNQPVVRCGTFGTSFSPHMVTTDGQPTTYPPAGVSTSGVKNCSFSMVPGVRYYWRVRGVDTPAQAYGVFSDTAEFTYQPTDPDGPVVPVMTAPVNNSTTSAPVLTWEPLSGYSEYQVVITPLAGGTTTTAATYSTSYTPTKTLAVGSYSWYVRGRDAYGVYGLIPGERPQFTIAAPTPTSSMNPVAVTGDGSPNMPSMTWQPLAGAGYYRVSVSRQGSGVWKVIGDKLPYTAYTSTTPPEVSGDYEWVVEAFTSSGGAIGEPAFGTFTISQLPFTTYVSPSHCSLASSCAPEPKTPELRWTAVPNASFYRVWVALDENFTNLVRGYQTVQTSLTPRESYPDNEAGQSYYWFVQPCQGNTNLSSTIRCGEFGGDSLLQHERAFRKQSKQVVPLSPANTVDPNLPDVVSFRWQDYSQTTNNIMGVKRYRLQVATDAMFATIVDDVLVDQPFYQAWSKSYPDNVYYWRVQAIDGGDIPLAFSPVGRFQKTSQVPAPAATPAVVGLPTLTWAALPYASGYALEIYKGTSSLFPSTSKVVSATAKLPSFTPTAPLPAGTYSWRIRKLNPDGSGGPWSTAVPTFTVKTGTPTLSAPADLATVTSNDLLFSWLTVAGATSYLFESSTSSAFSTTVERVTTVMTTWAAVKLYPDGSTYYWRVRVLDGDGNVLATSAVRRIVKDAAAPTVASVSPTSGLAIDGTITVTFSEPVIGVSAGGLALRVAGTTTAVAGTVTPASGVTTTTATFRPTAALVPGQYYDLTVGSGIKDVAGNPMLPATTRVRTAPGFENTSAALREQWDIDLATGASGGAYLSAATAGAMTTFNFTGSSVSVLGHTSPVGGNAAVYLDGVQQVSVGFYNPTEQFQKVVFAKTGLTTGAHTLMIKVLGTKPAGSGGTAVDLDAFVAGATFQEGSSAVTTTFARMADSGASGGSYDLVEQDDAIRAAAFRFDFRGTGFTVYGLKQPTGGTADVLVDGVKRGQANFYSSTATQKVTVFSWSGLADGAHRVEMVATPTRPTGSTGTAVTLDSVMSR